MAPDTPEDDRRALTDGETPAALRRAARRSTTGGDLELTRRNRWPVGSRGSVESSLGFGWRGKVLSTIVAAGFVYTVMRALALTSAAMTGDAAWAFTQAQAQNYAVMTAVLVGFLHLLGHISRGGLRM